MDKKHSRPYDFNRTAWMPNYIIGDGDALYPLRVSDKTSVTQFVALAKLRGQITAMVQGTTRKGI